MNTIQLVLIWQWHFYLILFASLRCNIKMFFTFYSTKDTIQFLLYVKWVFFIFLYIDSVNKDVQDFLDIQYQMQYSKKKDIKRY